MTELVFIVEETCDGFYARAVGSGIIARASTRDELVRSVQKAVSNFYESSAVAPKLARLHYVHDETISLVEPSSNDWRMLQGTLLRYDDPTEPVGVEDWEALK